MYNLLWNLEFRLSKAHTEYVNHHTGVNSLTQCLLKVKRQAFKQEASPELFSGIERNVENKNSTKYF